MTKSLCICAESQLHKEMVFQSGVEGAEQPNWALTSIPNCEPGRVGFSNNQFYFTKLVKYPGLLN